MELNVVGARAEIKSEFNLDKKTNFINNINFLVFPDIRINVVKLFFSIRKIKHCNVLYLILDENFKKKFSILLYPFLNTLFRFIIKFPHGPSIVIEDKAKTGFLRPIADIYKTDSGNIVDTLKKAYMLNKCGHPEWIYNARIQKERIDWLKRNCNGKVLEVGCANGFILNYVGGGAGIDINELRLEYARERYKNSTFILGDAAKMPFSDKEYDTVIIPDILEHVEYDYARLIIKECCRVGKKLLITVPNAGKKNYNKNLVENPEHKWYPTKDKMIELAGSKDIKIDFSKRKDFIFIKKFC